MNMFEQSQASFDILYGSLPIAVVLFDTRARIICANKSFQELVNTSAPAEKLPKLLHFIKELERPFKEGIFFSIGRQYNGLQLSTNDGKSIPVHLCFAKLDAGDDNWAGAIGFITDLREINAAKTELHHVSIENRAFREQLTGKAPERVLNEKANLEKDLKAARQFLENILESCGDGIMSFGSDACITMVNESLAAMLGKSKDDLIGKFSYDLGPMSGEFTSTTGERIILDQSYTQYQESKLLHLSKLTSQNYTKIEDWEFYAFHQNGSIVPLEFTVSVSLDEQGSYIGSVASARNLTKKKIAEQKLKESAKFLESVIEASYDGIVVSDMNGIILSANSALGRMTGFAKDAILGKRFTDLVEIEQPPDDVSKDRWAKLYEKGQTSFETSFKNKAGETVNLDHSIALIKHTDDEYTLYRVSIIRDITEKKKAEQKLHEAYDFRNQFFTNITHAFRTPLTLAISPMEDILQGRLGTISPEISDQLELSLRNSRQLLKLINQLLDFSRIESGKRSVVYVEKDLNKLIVTVLDSFAFIAQKKKIDLAFSPGSDIPYISLDPIKMEKILFNLVGNAFKFTPDMGTISISVVLSNTEQDRSPSDETAITTHDCRISAQDTERSYVKIIISDTGIGIKAAELTRIFERFSQGAHSFDPQSGGTGIGLAHAKEIVELMEGCLTVKSTYGQGSQFAVYLPVEHNDELDSLPIAERSDTELLVQPDIELADVYQENDILTKSLSGTKPLILIMDDNPDVRHYIGSMVKNDYDFITARNGTEGLTMLKKHLPAVILCDIMMPEMDGPAFLHKVKENPEWQHISFIFLTARADTEMKLEGLEQGADDYIVKPFNSLELLARIKSLLRIRALINQTATQQHTISHLTQKLEGHFAYGNIIGNSPPMRRIYDLLETVKETESTILISGETGTGKELIANAIHYNSPRKNRPMVSVNCGAIPKELMEREFFGHIKGAYTGAHTTKKGYFTEAEGGTLFLDEIGEMDRDMQVKLLRVLERGELIRVGESVPTKIDVRLIAATNKDLLAEVRSGNFREDLYYRIHVIPLHVPPLRERQEDIALLIDHFIIRFQKKLNKAAPPLSEKDMKLFLNHGYPGNVRELEHILERFCLLGGNAENLFTDTRPVAADESGDFPYDELLASSNPLKAVGQKAKSEAERELIKHTLTLCDNDYTEASSMLNIGLSSLYRKLKELEVNT